MHFNNNLKRDELVSPTGKMQVKVVYPKFKNGEATVRSVRVRQNFGKLQNYPNKYSFVYVHLSQYGGMQNYCHCRLC